MATLFSICLKSVSILYLVFTRSISGRRVGQTMSTLVKMENRYSRSSTAWPQWSGGMGKPGRSPYSSSWLWLNLAGDPPPSIPPRQQILPLLITCLHILSRKSPCPHPIPIFCGLRTSHLSLSKISREAPRSNLSYSSCPSQALKTLQ